MRHYARRTNVLYPEEFELLDRDLDEDLPFGSHGWVSHMISRGYYELPFCLLVMDGGERELFVCLFF